jgi:hypothetical protein
VEVKDAYRVLIVKALEKKLVVAKPA